MSKKMIIRQSAVAGQFYPAQREELDAQLASLFDQTKKISLRGRPKILIVPHAGIVYSGKVAAWGFKQIENLGYSKIMLLGASHQTFFQHAAIFG
ncbi:AmmeMemoRadiSam system protein B, partial [Candidatus Shapirobacteria bacterium CG09_land_8_20_14_0_10_47_13]